MLCPPDVKPRCAEAGRGLGNRFFSNAKRWHVGYVLLTAPQQTSLIHCSTLFPGYASESFSMLCPWQPWPIDQNWQEMRSTCHPWPSPVTLCEKRWNRSSERPMADGTRNRDLLSLMLCLWSCPLPHPCSLPTKGRTEAGLTWWMLGGAQGEGDRHEWQFLGPCR